MQFLTRSSSLSPSTGERVRLLLQPESWLWETCWKDWPRQGHFPVESYESNVIVSKRLPVSRVDNELCNFHNFSPHTPTCKVSFQANVAQKDIGRPPAAINSSNNFFANRVDDFRYTSCSQCSELRWEQSFRWWASHRIRTANWKHSGPTQLPPCTGTRPAEHPARPRWADSQNWCTGSPWVCSEENLAEARVLDRGDPVGFLCSPRTLKNIQFFKLHL